MAMKKDDKNNKYRKKKYTPSPTVPPKSIYLPLYEQKHSDFLKLHKELNKNLKNALDLIEDVEEDDIKLEMQSLIERLESSIKQTSQDIEVYAILIDACKKGADINILYDLHVSDGELPHGTSDFPFIATSLKDLSLHKDLSAALERFEERRKKFIKLEKSINAAVKRLLSLPPIPEDVSIPDNMFYESISVQRFNEGIEKLKYLLKISMDRYLDLTALSGDADHIYQRWEIKNPRKWLKTRYKTAKRIASEALNEIVVGLVNIFTSIGYSENQAYIKIAKLLHYFHPHLFPEPDADLVRQRFSYRRKVT